MEKNNIFSFFLKFLLFTILTFVGILILYHSCFSFTSSRAGNIYYPDPSVADQGGTTGRSAWNLANAIGSSKKAILKFQHTGSGNETTYTFTTTRTFTLNITFEIESGAILSNSGGANNLEIKGPAILPNSKCIDWTGTGKCQFLGPGHKYRPEHYGAVMGLANVSYTAYSLTNYNAFYQMMRNMQDPGPGDSSAYWPTIELGGAIYYLKGDPAWTIDKYCDIEGMESRLYLDANSTGTFIRINSHFVNINNLWVTRAYISNNTVDANSTLNGIGIHYDYCNTSYLNDISITGFEYGIRFYPETDGNLTVSYIWINNCYIVNNLKGVSLKGPESPGTGSVTHIHFTGGDIWLDEDAFTSEDDVSFVEIIDTNSPHEVDGCTFENLTMQGCVERKVYCEGSRNKFVDIYWDAGEFDTGNCPYQTTVTDCNYSDGVYTIVKNSHGLNIVDGDLAIVTGGTNTENRGYYVITYHDNNQFNLSQKMSGTGNDLALSIYRADIEFTSDAQWNMVEGGSNIDMQAITDLGKWNRVVSPRGGITIGTAMHDQGLYELPTIGRDGFLQIVEGQGSSGTQKIFFDATGTTPSTIRHSLQFRAKDSYGRMRAYGELYGTCNSNDSDRVKGGIALFSYPLLTSQNPARMGLNEDGMGYLTHPSTGRGTTNIWTAQNDAIADDGYIDLPDVTSGMCFASVIDPNDSFTEEAGMWVISTNGNVTKISGSANTADTDSDTDLCCFDNGTYARVKNRMGDVGELRVWYIHN